MTFYFTSDLHFGHKNIIGFCDRPWTYVEDMNQGLVDNWNSVVGVNDVVHVLGDLCWGRPQKFVQWLGQLQGQKWLTPGNHDTVWKGRSSASRTLLESLGWHIKPEQWVFNLMGQMHQQRIVNVSHMPYTNDNRHDDAYAPDRPVDNGLWLLHGHTHGEWKVRDRMIDVGVDVWDYKPVSEATLMEIIDG